MANVKPDILHEFVIIDKLKLFKMYIFHSLDENKNNKKIHPNRF